jgi:hypothetical protein
MEDSHSENTGPFSIITTIGKWFVGSVILSSSIQAVTQYAIHFAWHAFSGLSLALLIYWANNHWFPPLTAYLSKQFPKVFPPKKEKK